MMGINLESTISLPALAPQMPDKQLISSLQKAGFLEASGEAKFTTLTGGVASEIWKVETSEQIFCIKRALPKLKVEADWFVSLERNRYEVAWCQIARKIAPGSAPRIFFQDKEAMFFCMEYLDPVHYPLWKNELRDCRVDPNQAENIGRNLGKIHSASASDKKIHNQFPRTDIFHAIRLEPYLEATASKHPDLSGLLFSLSRETAETRPVMIHGDTSPKNIMLGVNGPVFLDAECACMGDPAFDLAFCLKHFLLKCLWVPTARESLLKCFEVMIAAYFLEVSWEDPAAVESRTAKLLPGLFLGRIDGKSPVEYIVKEDEKNKVRRCAADLLVSPSSRLMDVVDRWKKELSR